jgi:hypothetical protein
MAQNPPAADIRRSRSLQGVWNNVALSRRMARNLKMDSYVTTYGSHRNNFLITFGD